MVKDGGQVKKKRKTVIASETDGDVDIYRKVVEFEEKEALSRNHIQDAETFTETCNDIRQILAEMYEISTTNATQRKQELLLDLCIKISVIKKLNRIDKIQHVFGKEALNAEKQKCDSIKLIYQNLVYELNHIVHEISKCNSFKSKHEDIDLIKFDEFMKEAPSELTEKFKNGDHNDPEYAHNLTLARLEYELEQRKALAKLLEVQQEEKKKFAGEIIERKNKLDGLLPLLKAVVNATKPLQEYLNIPNDKVRDEHVLAKLLPDPLYIFYANAVAYKNVYDAQINVDILGDQEEATQFNETANMNALSEAIDSEVDTESQELEEVVEVKKRRHRKSVQIDPMEEKKKKIVEVHPLSIKVSLNNPELPIVTLILKYCTKLKIVTVTSKVDLPAFMSGHCAQELLSGDNVLSELSPGDFGVESPNPSTPFQLKRAGISSFKSLIPQIGYAYSWAQASCGLDFLSKKIAPEELGRINVEYVLKSLNKRLTSRTQLANQLHKLEQNLIPEISDTEVPLNIVSSLIKFSSSSYLSFCLAPYTQSLVEEECVSPSDLYFLATIARNNATLESFVVIKNNYPHEAPVFSLCFRYKNATYNCINNDDIRDMERAINLDVNKDLVASEQLLAVQITYLCSFLDIFLQIQYPNDFPQSAMVVRNISGRSRRSPYKFRKIGIGIFTQY